MKRTRTRKCLCCGELFEPDARNAKRQKCCRKKACRATLKAARQQRWLGKPENRDYFRGVEHVERVRLWRAAHPGYWRRRKGPPTDALQDAHGRQGIEAAGDFATPAERALQDALRLQGPVLIGLIAHLSDSTLQDDIAQASRRLLQLGQDILSGRAPDAWLDEIANVRIHGETRQRPRDLFEAERQHLKAPNTIPYDLARVLTLRASPQFRVRVDTNRYSVPAEYTGRLLTVKLWPDLLCVYHQDQLIARHTRRYDRHKDFEDPDHPKALLAQRRNAREQRLLSQFLTLSPQAPVYYEGLTARQLNARMHLAKILALSEIYGRDATARALDDALAFHAFSSQYIAHLLEARSRTRIQPVSPLSLTRRQDLLELELPEPDLSIYEVPDHE